MDKLEELNIKLSLIQSKVAYLREIKEIIKELNGVVSDRERE